MPTVHLTANGNGRLTCQPSSNVSSGTVVTVRAYPYEGESLVDIIFYDNTWTQIGVYDAGNNTWQFRVTSYDINVVATFTEHEPTPPEPPDPPDPPDPPHPPTSLSLSYFLFKNNDWWRY